MTYVGSISYLTSPLRLKVELQIGLFCLSFSILWSSRHMWNLQHDHTKYFWVEIFCMPRPNHLFELLKSLVAWMSLVCVYWTIALFLSGWIAKSCMWDLLLERCLLCDLSLLSCWFSVYLILEAQLSWNRAWVAHFCLLQLAAPPITAHSSSPFPPTRRAIGLLWCRFFLLTEQEWRLPRSLHIEPEIRSPQKAFRMSLNLYVFHTFNDHLWSTEGQGSVPNLPPTPKYPASSGLLGDLPRWDLLFLETVCGVSREGINRRRRNLYGEKESTLHWGHQFS